MLVPDGWKQAHEYEWKMNDPFMVRYCSCENLLQFNTQWMMRILTI
jgi:hypothetical protein